MPTSVVAPGRRPLLSQTHPTTRTMPRYSNSSATPMGMRATALKYPTCAPGHGERAERPDERHLGAQRTQVRRARHTRPARAGPGPRPRYAQARRRRGSSRSSSSALANGPELPNAAADVTAQSSPTSSDARPARTTPGARIVLDTTVTAYHE